MTLFAPPDLAALVQPLLGTPYRERFCFDLARALYQQGWGLLLESDPASANQHLCEVWQDEDPRDPLALVQTWDALVFWEHPALRVSSHVGIALDAQQFVHARNVSTGVAIERLRRYRARLLQIVRLRRLLT